MSLCVKERIRCLFGFALACFVSPLFPVCRAWRCSAVLPRPALLESAVFSLLSLVAALCCFAFLCVVVGVAFGLVPVLVGVVYSLCLAGSLAAAVFSGL